MSSNVRTLLVTRDEYNQLSVNEVDLADVSQFEQQEEVFLHPLLIAMSHSLIHGLDYSMDLEEEKNKLTEVEFKNLETCGDITNCAICMENKKLNIKLKCNHIFCKGCIKKWLTEKSNTCPNCRTEI
jgi:hypothetical protein|tara:strand:- start:9498 stop:9878 length:381 start_codon:yes stop_codon:yes gene_type:complete